MTKRIAIIGAGPTGVEAAVRLKADGHDVDLYEKGAPGSHVARWSHVRFFSAWSLNRSPWGERLLREAGVPLEDENEFPTGEEFLTKYLRPLVETCLPDGRVHLGTEVRQVGRSQALKGDFIGDPNRARDPFLLHLVKDGVESFAEADVVIDASGVYERPNHFGPGGVPALGEADHADRIEYWIPDPTGEEREIYAGQRILVVGAGHSAVTSLKLLHELADEEPQTRIHWVLRGDRKPYELLEDDPLPERVELSRFGNQAAAASIDGILPEVGAMVRSVETMSDGSLEVVLQRDTGRKTVNVDRIVANVGYRPDTEITRELQVHHCWASEGPMKLAASLLSSSGSADCLQQSAAGFDTLTSPEPDFFVLGAKSYGRNSRFLLKVGFEQIEEVASHLT